MNLFNRIKWIFRGNVKRNHHPTNIKQYNAGQEYLNGHFKEDSAYSIMQLRNRVHELEIELGWYKEELRDDASLQASNVAVKDAWDQYQIVLKLAKK